MNTKPCVNPRKGNPAMLNLSFYGKCKTWEGPIIRKEIPVSTNEITKRIFRGNLMKING